MRECKYFNVRGSLWKINYRPNFVCPSRFFDDSALANDGVHGHSGMTMCFIESGFRIFSIMKDVFYKSPKQPKGNDNRMRSLAYNFDAGQVWYLVHCKPNCERLALRNLENQGFPAFLPLQKLTLRNDAAFQTRLRPLFPGYMFVAQDPAAGQWRKINNTRGVARLVCLAAEPTPVPLKIMDQLFERCDRTGVFQQSTNLVAGNNAKITEGPFVGAIGKIIEIDPDQRVNLLFDFLGQKSTLTIDSTSVMATS